MISGEEVDVETLRWARGRMEEERMECDKMVRELKPTRTRPLAGRATAQIEESRTPSREFRVIAF